jgi:hypothetical protein
MAAITLPKGALLQIYGVDASANGGDGTTKWNTVTDHNRGQFTLNHNRIEQSKRMANGTLRKFFVADKKSFSTAWSNIPSRRLNGSEALTSDAFGAGLDIKNWHEANTGDFWMLLVYDVDSSVATTDIKKNVEKVNVFFGDFSYNVTDRGQTTDLWNINLSLVEV